MTHSHPHSHHSDAAAAAEVQREATVIGWVDGTAIPRELLDARVRELRAGRLAARLPVAGSKEDRQFLRWTAQVLLTEELCWVELARLQPGSESPAKAAERSAPAGAAASDSAAIAAPRPLTQAASLHLGSINAAVWTSTPAMSALYDIVTEPSLPATRGTGTRTWYRVTHAVAATALDAATTAPTSLGWTTLDDLPAPLAAELRTRAPGTRVGPVRTGLGWHFATVTAIEPRPLHPTQPADPTDPARLTTFNRWLDQRRRALITHAPGFEHPGDPTQPDNTHRH
ncbi:[acyl-carrier-protein] S-malonyltransferase [Catenulispora sp. GAS73]|uniref:peptidylprolyl isomerase n=1 Tax=Catenulispora sp. GAS73 TaxID=3156269 RepID=UPI003514815F